MAKRPLELEVRKGSTRYDVFEDTADPDNLGALQDALTGWLDDNGWRGSVRGKFELFVREPGGFRVLKKVRAS